MDVGHYCDHLCNVRAAILDVDQSCLVVSQLLDFEARSGEQVPLLLKMKRSQLALSKAVESGDTDLGELAPPPTCLSAP